MFKTVVIGVDGSQPSNNALQIACGIAEKFNSKLHLVHTPKAETVAFVVGAVAGYHAMTTMPSQQETLSAAEEVLSRARKQVKAAGHADVVTHIGEHDPAGDILEYANRCGADLIVTGRRGLGDVAGLVLGSTSHRIGHDAKCAHLTVA